MTPADRIHAFMLEYQDDHQRPPSLREIAAAVSYKSVSTVHLRLNELILDGRVSYAGIYESRGYVALRPAPVLPPLPPRYRWPFHGEGIAEAHAEPGRFVFTLE